MIKPLPADELKSLKIAVNNCELRRDLHVFVNYVASKEIKRAYRTNMLTKSDALKLAKMMTDPDAIAEVNSQDGCSVWVDFIDDLSLKLGFVKYDTKGTYVGYSSNEPAFPDNYIEVNEKKYQDFLALSLQEQERAILACLMDRTGDSNNEFYQTGVVGRLDGFSTRGCATGVIPLLTFTKIRQFLFEILQHCQPNLWYSTSSLIEYLKEHHRYFLIPKDPQYKYKHDKNSRYGNFHEGKERWHDNNTVPENAPDGFERVEGRYIERFLESIPLTMRYLDVAYAKKPEQTIFPSINMLKAFRLNERFLRVMKGEIAKPKVTIQPNFEIQIESELYPAQTVAKLSALAEIISDDTAIILKLKKEKVASALIENEKLDVVAELTELTGRALPQNIIVELQEWVGHSEMFTLYHGFALLEGKKALADLDQFTAVEITPTLRIVDSPDKLYRKLEQSELVPLRIKHSPDAIKLLPEHSKTVFLKQTKASTKPPTVKPAAKPQITIKRETKITFYFPDAKLMEEFRKELQNHRCPFETDDKKFAVSFVKSYENQVKEIIKTMTKERLIRIEDIE